MELSESADTSMTQPSQWRVYPAVLPKRVEKVRKAKLLAKKKKPKPAVVKPSKREDKSPGMVTH